MSDYKYCPLRGGECLYNRCGWWSIYSETCSVIVLSKIDADIQDLQTSIGILGDEAKKCGTFQGGISLTEGVKQCDS